MLYVYKDIQRVITRWITARSLPCRNPVDGWDHIPRDKRWAADLHFPWHHDTRIHFKRRVNGACHAHYPGVWMDYSPEIEQLAPEEWWLEDEFAFGIAYF